MTANSSSDTSGSLRKPDKLNSNGLQVCSRKDHKWYFSNQNNVLISPKQGLDDIGALASDLLTDDLVSERRKHQNRHGQGLTKLQIAMVESLPGWKEFYESDVS